MRFDPVFHNVNNTSSIFIFRTSIIHQRQHCLDMSFIYSSSSICSNSSRPICWILKRSNTMPIHPISSLKSTDRRTYYFRYVIKEKIAWNSIKWMYQLIYKWSVKSRIVILILLAIPTKIKLYIFLCFYYVELTRNWWQNTRHTRLPVDTRGKEVMEKALFCTSSLRPLLFQQRDIQGAPPFGLVFSSHWCQYLHSK